MLVQLIDSAKLTIDAAVYAFSSNDLLYALDRARQRGVKLRMISEGDTVDNKGSDVNTVKSWGVEVKIRHAAPKLMHHKFAVVDNAYVSTGSFNWTAAARADNNENIVILNDPNIIKAFNAEFQKLWGSL
ncbi:Phosphatidylserine/phosphatidylglycerophosphate/cardiolipin synthase [Hyaloraphidium curvatum]|nr:Phosphatidylserine/phosphatidylglycerophosphate/cardiolipin synthase [Hyaloraphidium curvatum]